MSACVCSPIEGGKIVSHLTQLFVSLYVLKCICCLTGADLLVYFPPKIELDSAYPDYSAKQMNAK